MAAVSDGKFNGSTGMTKGRSCNVGSSVALAIGGVTLVINSKRTQCLSADQISFIGGLDPAAARSVVVKSTVHYRAGFPSFPPSQIFEVSAPGGLTTPDHTKLSWERLPRPVYPLDGDKAVWTPPPAVHDD